MTATSQRIEFTGSHDATLAARLDMPAGEIRAYAIFAVFQGLIGLRLVLHGAAALLGRARPL